MDPSSTPDSWDTNSDAISGESASMNNVENSMSALNVNATPFVPGQNVFAREFVPTFPKSSDAEQENESDTSGDQPMNSDDAQVDTANLAANGGDEKGADDAPDEWDDKGEDGGSTPDKGGGGAEREINVEEEDDTEDENTVQSQRVAHDKRKDHLNIIFIGHVDAGKSTIGGHIMYLTGQVDKRTLEKYEREAKEKNRETWYLSWALDTNLEERDKGKTVEVGRAYFDTESKHFTILDAPGHKGFVPNMIGGASQADVAVLVISARKGEFETGFDRGGQTGEHAMLVKTAGVKFLVVVVNKMDDPTVEWSEKRYNDIKDRLTPYLKKCGFNPKTDIFYLPVSGLTGYNLKHVNKEVCPWYKGPSLIDYLDNLNPVSRMADGPVRMPVVDRYKDMGTIVFGKLECGKIVKNQVLTLMPNKVQTVVDTVWAYDEEATEVFPGESVKLKLKNVDEEDVTSGFVLCTPESTCNTAKIFDAQIVIMEHKSIICAGYSAVMHIHTAAEEVSIKNLICLMDRKTGEKSAKRPRFIKQDQIAIVRLEVPGGSICMEPFKEFPQMGRFTLRDEGKTIAIGKVLKLIN